MRPGQLTPENRANLGAVNEAGAINPGKRERTRASMRPGQLTPENAATYIFLRQKTNLG